MAAVKSRPRNGNHCGRREQPLNCGASAPRITGVKSMGYTIYELSGYTDREDYLKSLTAEFGPMVRVIADLLGPNEDFDGLLTELDYLETGDVA